MITTAAKRAYVYALLDYREDVPVVNQAGPIPQGVHLR